MRHHGRKVRHGGEDGEDADECVEGGRGAEVDAAEDGTRAAHHKLRTERITPKVGNLGQPCSAWRGVVAGKCPKHAAGGGVCGGNAGEYVEEEDYQEAGRAGFGSSRGLEIDGGEGKLADGGVDHVVEGGDGVKDGNVEYKGCYEAGEELRDYAFGDVAFGVGNFLGNWRCISVREVK